MLPILLVIIISALIIVGIIYNKNQKGMPSSGVEAPTATAVTGPTGGSNPGGVSGVSGVDSVGTTGTSGISGPSAPTGAPQSAVQPDLTVDANGLSKASVVMKTSQGIIKFKFYPTDAPNTVKRIAELINQGFYNGLTFHRVVPNFVIQGGDPVGNGTGGSGQKLKAEFNKRRHVEGAVAMARAADPDSADSQFYISLGTHPHLDNQYTIFGQVIEGMDVARKIQVGDRITSIAITN